MSLPKQLFVRRSGSTLTVAETLEQHLFEIGDNNEVGIYQLVRKGRVEAKPVISSFAEVERAERT